MPTQPAKKTKPLSFAAFQARNKSHRISFEAFAAWLRKQPKLIKQNALFDEEDEFEDDGVQFHAGSLTTDRLWIAPVTVVDGDLTVDEIKFAYDVGLLVVTGTLTIPEWGRALATVVGKDLVAGSICANTLNDHALVVGRDIRCDHFVEFGCFVEAHGKIVCPKVLSLMNKVVAHGGVEGEQVDGLRGRDVAQVLVDAVLTKDGYFDEEKYKKFVRSGKSPLRA